MRDLTASMVYLRARSVAAATVLAVALGWGCAAAPRAHVGVITQQRVDLLAGSSEGALGAPVLLPAMAEPVLVSVEPSGERNVRFGSLRAVIRGSTIAWASDRFAVPIREAVPLGSRWVFIARDGTVAGSASFVGPLVRLGTLPDGYRALPGSRGRMLVLDNGGALLATDGEAPFAPLPTLPPGTLIDAAFVDRDTGIALLEGGELYRTADGGRAWARLDLGPEAAFRVMRDGDAFAAETTAGPRMITPQGEVTPRPAPLPAPNPAVAAPTPARLAPDESDRLVVSALARFPALPYAYGGVRLASGLMVANTGNGFSLLDVNTGRRAVLNVPERREGCELRPWGGLAGVECGGASPFTAALNERGLVTIAGVGALAFPAFSDDGHHMVARGQCDGAPLARAAAPVDLESDQVMGVLGAETDALCTAASPRGPLRALPAPGDHARPLDMHGAAALLSVDRQDGDDLGLRVLDVERGSLMRPRLAGGGRASELSVRSARWLPGGVGISAIGVWANESADPDDDEPDPRRPLSAHPERARVAPVLLWGPAGAPLLLRALPEGVESVGFTDAVHGVAAGPSIDLLFRTADAGVHWEQARVAIDGAAKTVRLESDASTGLTALRCGRWGCLVGGRVWFPAGSDAVDAQGATLAAPPGAAAAAPATEGVREPAMLSATQAASDIASPAGVSPWQRIQLNRPAVISPTSLPAASGAGRYFCAGPAAGITSLLRVLAPSRRGAVRRTLATAGADGLLDAWLDRGRPMLQFRWNGEDSVGNFQGATQPTQSQAQDPGADMLPYRAPRYSFWSAGRTGAVIERCVDDAAGGQCEVLFASARGGIVPLPDLTAFGHALHARVAIDGVLPVATGGFLVLTSGRTTDASLMVDMVTLLAPDGRVALRRAFAFHEHRLHGLARVPSGVGYATAKSSDPRAFVFYAVDPAGALGAAQPLPVIPAGPLPLCPAAARPDATELALSAPGFVPEVQIVGSPSLPMASLLELRPAQTCLRAVQSVAPMTATGYAPVIAASRGLRLTVGNDGRLAGLLDDGTLSRLLQCNPH